MEENRLKPKATSFEIIDRETGEVVAEYVAPNPPTKPDANSTKEAKKEYQKEVQDYTEALRPDFFEEKFPTCQEGLQPNMKIIYEKFKHILASSLVDIPIKEFVRENSHLFQTGKEVLAHVSACDGCDGFGGKFLF